MKRAAILGARRAGLVDAPDPEPHDDWAVVKVHSAPMCAEYKAFEGGQQQSVMGHEAAGEVVSVGPSSAVAVGDRVVAMPLVGCGRCAYCLSGDYIHCLTAFELSGYVSPVAGSDTMAQLMAKPSWLLKSIPDDIGYDRAALTCCGLGPSFGAFQAMRLAASDRVLITGAGPVGLGALVNARFRGARAFVVESVPYRMDRAREMGAEAVIDPRDPGALEEVRQLADGGVDCALDCSGSVRAQRFCIDATRRKGRVGFIGECNEELQIKVSPDMIRKGLTLHGSWHYNLNDFPKVMDVARRSPLIDLLISHVLPMSRIQEAFELSASHNTAKVILKPWE